MGRQTEYEYGDISHAKRFWFSSHSAAYGFQQLLLTWGQFMGKSNFALGLLVVFSTAALATGTSPFPWPEVTRQISRLLSGLGVGVLLLILIFFLLRSGAVRVPIGVCFATTSVLLYYLAFVFGGKGIRELQNAGLIGVTPATWVPSSGILGLCPTYETVALQILLIGAAALAITYLFLIRKREG